MKKSWWLLLGILIIAAFFRLYHLTLTPPGLYPDEAMDGNNALMALHPDLPNEGFKVFYPYNNGEEGLFANIEAMFIKFTGSTQPWVLRLPSAIFGILTVLGIYCIGRQLFSDKVGLLAAFFTAVSFWHVMFSRIGFRAIMAPFFLVWALYFLIKAVKRVSLHEYSIWYATIAGVFYGLGFYSYIAYRVTPVLVLFLLFFCWRKAREEGRQRDFLFATAIFIFTTFLVVMPLMLYFISHPGTFNGRTSEISIFSAASPVRELALNILKTVGMFIWHGDWNWRQNFAGAPELYLPVAILFFAGLAMAFYHVWARLRGKDIMPMRDEDPGQSPFEQSTDWGRHYSFMGAAICLLWLALAFAPVVFSDEGIPHALRSILMIPPVMLLAALAGVHLYHFIRTRIPRQTATLLAGVFLTLLAVQAYDMYFVQWANNPNVPPAFTAKYAAIADQINALPLDTPKYVVVRAGGVVVPVRQADGTIKNIPVPAQTVMFITDTYRAAGMAAKNVHYLLPGEENQIPAGSATFIIE